MRDKVKQNVCNRGNFGEYLQKKLHVHFVGIFMIEGIKLAKYCQNEATLRHRIWTI